MANPGQLKCCPCLISSERKKGTVFRNVAYLIIRKLKLNITSSVYMYSGVMGILLRPYMDDVTMYGLGVIIAFNLVFFLFFTSFIRVSGPS